MSVVSMICLSLSFTNWDLFWMSPLSFGDNMINSRIDMFRWHPNPDITFNSTLTFFILHTFISATNIYFSSCLPKWEKILVCSMVLSTSHNQLCYWGLDVTSLQPPYKCSCSLWGGMRGFAAYTGFSQNNCPFHLLL